jgi:hypothetical protein
LPSLVPALKYHPYESFILNYQNKSDYAI